MIFSDCIRILRQKQFLSQEAIPVPLSLIDIMSLEMKKTLCVT